MSVYLDVWQYDEEYARLLETEGYVDCSDYLDTRPSPYGLLVSEVLEHPDRALKERAR